MFSDYDQRLWERIRTVDAEVALALLWRYIAERTAADREEEDGEHPDRAAIARWNKEIDEASADLRGMNLRDPDFVTRIIAKYGPLASAGVNKKK